MTLEKKLHQGQVKLMPQAAIPRLRFIVKIKNL
jgi:hypothetical protein